jgi:TolA-binding protein
MSHTKPQSRKGNVKITDKMSRKAVSGSKLPIREKGFLLFSKKIICKALSVADLSRVENRVSVWFDRYCLKGVLIVMGMACLAAGFYLVRLSPEFPVLSYNKGIQSFTREDFTTARHHFKEVLDRFPQTLIVDQAGYHMAMCSFREKKWEDTIRELATLLEEYPETGRAGEAFYHMGICHLNLGRIGDARQWFSRTVQEFPDEIWARFAGDRLSEMGRP